MDSKKVSEVTKMSNRIYLKLHGMKVQTLNESSIRIMSSNYLSSVTNKKNLNKIQDYLDNNELDFLEKHSEGWLEEYLDNWDILDK